MSSAAALFFSDVPDRETLHRRIVPTEEQLSKQMERWKALQEYAIQHLRAASGSNIRTWIQGSYKFGTQIRPRKQGEEFDIDLGVYFEDTMESAIGIRTMVQACVDEFASQPHAMAEVLEVVEPPKERCSRLRYTGQFHIDLPTYRLNLATDRRLLATTKGAWEDSDPKPLVKWFQSATKNDGARTRRFIRYLKFWAALTWSDGEGRPPSILLTILVVESHPGTLPSGEDDAFLVVAEKVRHRLTNGSNIVNPANRHESLSARLGAELLNDVATKLTVLISEGRRAQEAKTDLEAALIWARVFGHHFPLPPPAELREKLEKGVKLGSQLTERVFRTDGEDSIFRPQVLVEVSGYTGGYGQATSHSGVNRVRAPIGSSLKFTILNFDNRPIGSVATWTARNHGDLAESVNDLGHPAGTGRTVTDSTAYLGTHYMDCIITLDTQLVGWRRVPIHVTKGIGN